MRSSDKNLQLEGLMIWAIFWFCTLGSIGVCLAATGVFTPFGTAALGIAGLGLLFASIGLVFAMVSGGLYLASNLDDLPDWQSVNYEVTDQLGYISSPKPVPNLGLMEEKENLDFLGDAKNPEPPTIRL